MGEAALSVEDGFFTVQLDLSETHLWEPGKGGLYTLLLTFGEDRVKSYFGLRTAKFQGRKFLLNGKSLFQRFVLDQASIPRHLHRPHGRGPGEGHPAVLCRGLQWRPAPREGL